MLRRSTLLLVTLFFMAPVAALAQGLQLGETVNCFDNYRFGSVQAPINPSVTSAVSGTPVAFSGMVTNTNPYPLVDGSLYVKVFRLRESTEKNPNGPHVVDQFFVANDINLPAGGSMPIAFEWQIPAHALDGDYKLATFFTVARKFNMLGLSFTDDVVGNTTTFRVVGERTDGVFFNKDAVTINDTDYYFAAFPPRVSAEESATITAPIVNTTDADVHAPVSWEVYWWDAQRREQRIATSKETLMIPKGGSAEASVVVKDAQYPVYLAVGKIQYKDTTSIVNVRFVREGIDRARINFPSVTEYPLQAGEQIKLFSCLHNTTEGAPEGELVLRLRDRATDAVIHEYSYDGPITGAMMGVEDIVTPTRTFDDFLLEAMLYQDDVLVDEAVMHYDCDTLNNAFCTHKKFDEAASVVSRGVTTQSMMLWGSAAAVVLLLVGVGGALLRRRRHTDDSITHNPPA